MMLGLPETGFADPETGNGPDVFQLADWLEGCVTFVDDSLSQYEVVDILHENYLTNQTDVQTAKNDAASKVAEAWGELNRRSTCLGMSAPYRIHGVRLEQVANWEETPAFAFCLLAALRPCYRTVFKKKDYNKQGYLFEQLTLASLEVLGWQVHGVGWSKEAANSIEHKVGEVARFLGVQALEESTEQWTAPKAKDAGLDVVCQYPFSDGWTGRPIVLTQCACGENWKDKLHTPDLNTWRKLVDFCTAPTRGLSMPFVVAPGRFRRAAVRDGISLLLDRHRLMVPHLKPLDWLPSGLTKSLTTWVRAYVKKLKATAA